MIRRQLFQAAAIVPIAIDGTNFLKAAGTGTYVSAPINTQGFDSVAIVTLLGAVTATSVVTQTVQDGNQSNLSDAQSLLNGPGGSTASQSFTSPTSDSVIGWDVYEPQKQYLQVTTVIGTANAAINAMVAILFNAKQAPVTQGSLFAGFVELNSPPDAATA
jgi:hypothetical protein